MGYGEQYKRVRRSWMYNNYEIDIDIDYCLSRFSTL